MLRLVAELIEQYFSRFRNKLSNYAFQKKRPAKNINRTLHHSDIMQLGNEANQGK
jgi:hypothetical protein